MFWTSIVSHFTDSSRIAAVYALITLIILKESFDNQKVIYMQDANAAFKGDWNEVCIENRILYNYWTKPGYHDEHNNQKSRDYSNSIKNKTININDFTTDKNYFVVPYIYEIHVIVLLSTTAISPHLLPISFHLLNKKNI